MKTILTLAVQAAMVACDGVEQAPASAPALNADGSSFAVPPVTRAPSLEGTPYADYRTPIPRTAADAAPAPKLRYRNGKLIEDNSAPVIKLHAEFGDRTSGRLVVPAYVGDIAYLAAEIQTEAQTPLAGKSFSVQSARGNPTLLMNEQSDAAGYIEFRVLANIAGRDTITVEAGGVSTKLTLDVQPAATDDWLGELDLRGVTPWSLLIATPLDLGRDRVVARFPASLKKLDGTVVRLAGFMLPLESSPRQKHFLLTANPPACFFHPPGGPTTVAEVHARSAIEVGYDPIVIEGRLKLVEQSDSGLMFVINEAQQVPATGR